MMAIPVILYLAFTVGVSIIAGRLARVKHPNVEKREGIGGA